MDGMGMGIYRKIYLIRRTCFLTLLMRSWDHEIGNPGTLVGKKTNYFTSSDPYHDMLGEGLSGEGC